MNGASHAQLEQAIAHHQNGRVREAEQIYRQVLAADANDINALRLLAILLHQTGRNDESIRGLSRAIDLTSDADATAKALLLLDLGKIQRDVGAVDAAIALFRRAVQLQPDNIHAHALLAPQLAQLGFIANAMHHTTCALAITKHPIVHSNLCLLSLNNPAMDSQQVLKIHRDWDRDYGGDCRATVTFKNDRTADRQLRIGYLSPDFRQHAVRYFIHPVLANHDRARFHITCYSSAVETDAVTTQFEKLADQWRDIRAMNLDKIESAIRADNIDILVDLAGHTQNSLVSLFPRRLAPVQVSMMGYPGTTGLSAMDYRITDLHCDPPSSEEFSSEKLVRIDGAFWCFAPLDESGEITALPAKSNRTITFGSVNSCSKLNEEVLETWAKILLAVPSSNLRIQHAAFSTHAARQRVADVLSRNGVLLNRVTFNGFTPLPEYFALIRTLDIGLDPFPFNGGTTTCHLLHRGVPIVTLAGDRHAARMGVSLLSAVGLPELIARSKDEYIEKTVALASDLDRLAQIRAGLRARMLNSALCDAPGYTRKLEAAMRSMWKSWCESLGAT